MKSYKQTHAEHGSCLVLRPKVQDLIINTPNSLPSGTSKGTDKRQESNCSRKAAILLVASVVLGVPVPVCGIPAPESERTLTSNHVISKSLTIWS
jgi:hypothetical protein